MNLKEAHQKMAKDMPLKKRMMVELWGVWFSVKHHFHRITKLCPHDTTFGPVRGKISICIDCMREVQGK